jgi:putative transcriptional regulator
MKTSYNGLWKILIDQEMQKKDLMEELGISSSTVAKMGKGENVSLDVLARICTRFNCDVGDLISFRNDN